MGDISAKAPHFHYFFYLVRRRNGKEARELSPPHNDISPSSLHSQDFLIAVPAVPPAPSKPSPTHITQFSFRE